METVKKETEVVCVEPHGHRYHVHGGRHGAGFNLSWGAVFAGAVAFLATFVLFTFITSAIGFGKLMPTSDNPFDGVGTGMMIWTIVTFVVSMFVGGFVAGLAARRAGALHGFLTWALSMLLILFLVTSSIAAGIGAVGRLVGSAAGAIGQVAKPVGQLLKDGAVKGFDAIGGELGKIDTKKLMNDVERYAKDSDIKELQPDYLKGQLETSKQDIMDAAKQIVTNPNDAEKTIKGVVDKLKERADKIAGSIDRDKLAQAVAKNTSLSEDEAKKAVESIEKGYKDATEAAKEQLDKAEKAIVKAQADIEKTIKDARETAEQIAHGVAKASLFTFIGFALALVLSVVAARIGSNKARNTTIED